MSKYTYLSLYLHLQLPLLFRRKNQYMLGPELELMLITKGAGSTSVIESDAVQLLLSVTVMV